MEPNYTEDTALSSCLGSDHHLALLAELGITTLGELLGATQGLLRPPSADPGWEDLFQALSTAISADRLEAYRHPLPLPPTGLLRQP